MREPINGMMPLRAESIEHLDFDPTPTCEVRVTDCGEPGAHWWQAHCPIFAVCEKHHLGAIEDATTWGHMRAKCSVCKAPVMRSVLIYRGPIR